MLPAWLHAAALLIALFVQSMGSPLAGAWLFFHLAGCAVLLKDGYPERNPVWYASLAWLLALGLSTFILAPVGGAAAVMWVLASMPTLALCLKAKHVIPYAKSMGGVLLVYAIGLIIQYALGVKYDQLNYIGYAWPLIDPNNAAAVINCGLIPAVYLALRNKKYLWLVLIFAAALFVTRSTAGAGAALIASFFLIRERHGGMAADFMLVGGILTALLTFTVWPTPFEKALTSFAWRFPIWEASLPLLDIRPWSGLGLGSFAFYYAQVRTEPVTAGWYAHNDILQFAIEMGIPAALAFCGLILSVAWTTTRKNIAPACVLLAVLLQSMVEFQFYVPAISLLLGLALAAHQHKEIP